MYMNFLPSEVHPFSETSNFSESSFSVYNIRVGKGEFLMLEFSTLDILSSFQTLILGWSEAVLCQDGFNSVVPTLTSSGHVSYCLYHPSSNPLPNTGWHNNGVSLLLLLRRHGILQLPHLPSICSRRYEGRDSIPFIIKSPKLLWFQGLSLKGLITTDFTYT